MQKEAAGFPKEDTPDNGGTRTAAAQCLDNLRIAEPFGERMRQQPDTQKEAMKGRERNAKCDGDTRQPE